MSDDKDAVCRTCGGNFDSEEEKEDHDCEDEQVTSPYVLVRLEPNSFKLFLNRSTKRTGYEENIITSGNGSTCFNCSRSCRWTRAG